MQKSKLQLKNKKWGFVPILQNCDFERGTEPGSRAYNNEGIGIPFIRVGNIAAQIQKQIYTNSENIKLCSKDDILIALDGSPGVVIRGIEGAYSSGIRKIVLKDSQKLNYDFIFYVLQTEKVQNTIKEHSTGMTIKHAAKSLEHIQIPLPPLPTQRKIVKILDSIQSAVGVQEKIIEKTKELKKAMMAKLFKEGTRGAKLKKTEVGEIPEDWKVATLGEICDYTTGKLNSNAAVENGKYPFFTCAQETYFTNSYSFNQQALLLAGNNAKGIYSVKHYKGKFEVYQRTYVLTIKNVQKVSYEFLLYELLRKLDALRLGSKGTTTKYLTANIIKNLRVILPSFSEQKEISNTLQTIDQKIEIEQKKETLYEELFRTMLNKIMNQEIGDNFL